MSDASASLIGSGVSQQLQQTGRAATPVNALSDTDTENGFSTIYQDVIGDSTGSLATDDTTQAHTDAATPVMPLQPLITTPIDGTDTAASATDAIDPLAMFLPVDTVVGNNLPQQAGTMAWSGYAAFADNQGAVAQSFAGDGELLVQTTPAVDASLSGSVQRSQQQLRDFLALQPTSVMLNDQPVVAAQSGDFIEQLMTIARDKNGSELTGVQATPQTLNSAFASQLTTAPLTESTLHASATARASGEAIQVTPQHPNWGQELGDRVQWMIGRQIQSAEIRLNPPELGSLEVRIHVQGDQATVNFSSPHGVVRDALDAALPRLRDMLAESGLNLADANVSSQSQGQQQQAGQSSGSSNGRDSDASLAQHEQSVGALTAVKTQSGMLDVFA